MLQYIIFVVALRVFRRCSIYFSMLHYIFLRCCSIYPDVALHSFFICLNVALEVFRALFWGQGCGGGNGDRGAVGSGGQGRVPFLFGSMRRGGGWGWEADRCPDALARRTSGR